MEVYKNTLTRDEKLSHNVDWLTEIIHRFTDAWLSRRDMATVNMQSPMRLEKVSASCHVPDIPHIHRDEI